jgi:hypothetical protein
MAKAFYSGSPVLYSQDIIWQNFRAYFRKIQGCPYGPILFHPTTNCEAEQGRNTTRICRSMQKLSTKDNTKSK